MGTTVITITNQKGGVGKTTTAAALLSSLHRRGAKVLGVDLDPQGSLGFSLGLDIERCATVYDVFRGEVEPESGAVRDAERRKLRARSGMSGTLLTSPLGASGSSGTTGTSGKSSGLLGRPM